MIFYTLPLTVEPLFTDNSLNTSLLRTVFPIRAKQLSMAATAGVIWVLRMRKVLAAKLVRVLQCLNLFLGKASRHIFSTFNPLNTNTPLTRTLSMAPSVPVLTRCPY